MFYKNLTRFREYSSYLRRISQILFVSLLISQTAHAWNVPFNPDAAEIQAASGSKDMLIFSNTFINWTCTVLSVYVGYKAASKLHNSDISGFIKAMTAAFIIGGAPYFSQYFGFH